MNQYIKTKSVPLEKVHSMLNPPQGGVRNKREYKALIELKL